MKHLTEVVAALLALAAVTAGGPASLPASAQGANRDRTLFVSAVDAKGEPVEALDAGAFVVREDGVRREVLRVSRANEPIDVASFTLADLAFTNVSGTPTIDCTDPQSCLILATAAGQGAAGTEARGDGPHYSIERSRPRSAWALTSAISSAPVGAPTWSSITFSASRSAARERTS